MTNNIKQRDNTGWQNLPSEWSERLRQILSARQVQSATDLNYELADLPTPDLMLGMNKAVALLAKAVMQQWKMMIVADFDTDGATSCAVALRGLSLMGAQHLDYCVPNRFIHGYGLTVELLADIPEQEQADLLITVDNGIASIEGVKLAQQRGMKVLITDHHLPGETLPEADAIINPNQEGDTFPSKNLAGVGVCFYLLLGLRKYLREQKWFEHQHLAEPKLNTLFDLVALGTVADVVPLDKLNRTLVNLGLARIRTGRAVEGINALITIAGRNVRTLVASDLGFSIAPRLNAAGRLEDMSLGIETLLSNDLDEATTFSHRLDEINTQRRNVEQTMQDDALLMLNKVTFEQGNQALGYCLYDKTWHQGVIGLLASRIKERKHRPVIAFAQGNEGELKGSARSIAGVHIRDVLALVANQLPAGVLTRFGGHAMAAGLTLAEKDLKLFEQQFIKVLERVVNEDDLQHTLLSDGELKSDEINVDFAEQLTVTAPWGQGFPEPQFHGLFTIVDYRSVGAQYDHLRLTLALESGETVTAMAFRQQQPTWLKKGGHALLHYRLNVNEFRGIRSVQLLVETLIEPALDPTSYSELN